ncbi:MAG: hypothetical protein OXC62_00150, partial [Aestuariivita sp.]|nr:hypothetical protein [Aestuariivita sp.]
MWKQIPILNVVLDFMIYGTSFQNASGYASDQSFFNQLLSRVVPACGCGLTIGHFFTKQVAFSAHSSHPDESTAPA